VDDVSTEIHTESNTGKREIVDLLLLQPSDDHQRYLKYKDDIESRLWSRKNPHIPDNDDIHSGDVNGEAPPVHEPGNIYE
jgi:hypothetical protein